jgi:hypothetical protein
MVERVVEKSMVNIIYPTLTKTDYTEWSLMMKVNLQVTGSGASSSPGLVTTTTIRLHSLPFFMLSHQRCRPGQR